MLGGAGVTRRLSHLRLPQGTQEFGFELLGTFRKRPVARREPAPWGPGGRRYAAEIEEGRALFKSRVSPDLYHHNFYERALVDILVRAKGHIKSEIW